MDVKSRISISPSLSISNENVVPGVNTSRKSIVTQDWSDTAQLAGIISISALVQPIIPLESAETNGLAIEKRRTSKMADVTLRITLA